MWLRNGKRNLHKQKWIEKKSTGDLVDISEAETEDKKKLKKQNFQLVT